MSLFKTTFYCESVGDTWQREKDIKETLADHGIDGASVFYGIGLWEGKQENTFKLEIVDRDTPLYIGSTKLSKATAIAADLATRFHQQRVLFTVEKIHDTLLVDRDGHTLTV